MPTAKKAVAKKAAPAKAAATKPSTAKAPAKKPSTRRPTTATPAAPKAVAKATARKTTRSPAAPGPAPEKDTPQVKKDAASAGGTKPTPAFDDKFLEAQRVLLLAERKTYLRQAETLQAEADSLAELREPGDVQFDEESGEGDTLAVERERDLALSARARQEVEEIDRALKKIEAGTYGICEVSGDPIPKARLQAIPQARERVEYKVGGFGRR
jgi:RNA polymerase-binding transcription factor DksA